MDSIKLSVNPKPHAVFIPFPLQGHITPQFRLAQLFHQQGFHVTFVNTVFNQNQFLSSKGNTFSHLIDFNFETFDDFIDNGDKITPRIRAVRLSSRVNFAGPLKDLVMKINENEKSPPVTCILGDTVMPFTIDIAKELGVPCMLFWVGSAGAFQVFKHHSLLEEKGLVPVKDETSNIVIDFLPGLTNLLVGDLPFGQHPSYKSDFPMKELEQVHRASGIIFNTFESLEQEVLSAISAKFPHIYNIGPLQLLQSYGDSKPMQCNPWEEQHECLEWLDKMKHNSVLYISFGSIANVPEVKLIELACGVLDSGYPFLWVMRPDTSKLSPYLMSKMKEKGYITSWTPQELVLNHPSIGGFITHSGWNSTLESLSAGVPMMCWPQFGDQPIISRYSCSNWCVGMEMMADFKRDEVVKLARELMEGVQGVELKRKSMEWKKLARDAISQGGSSCLSLKKLLEDARGLSSGNDMFATEKGHTLLHPTWRLRPKQSCTRLIKT